MMEIFFPALLNSPRLQQSVREYFRSSGERDENARFALAVLFLKYLTYAGKPPEEGREARFHIPFQASFDEIFKRRDDDNICDVIDIACYSLEELNKSKLGGIFSEFKFCKKLGESDSQRWRHYLRDSIEWANQFRFFNDEREDSHSGPSPTDARAPASPSKGISDSYTPPHLAQLLAELMSPRAGETIYDPACGYGNLLTAAWARSRKRAGGIFGQEIDPRIQCMARMNLIMNGIDHAQVAVGDSISEPRFVEDNRLARFHVILSNLPFRVYRWGRDLASRDVFDRFWRGVPPKGNGDWAFLSHLIESMADDGRAAVVVSNGVLFRGGVEAQIRRSVVDENLVDAVIALPSNLLPAAPIPCAILIFDKTRSARDRNDVLMVDATQEFLPGRVRNSLTQSNIARVVAWYRAFAAGTRADLPETHCRRVDREELARFDYTLNIAKYVRATHDEERNIEDLEDQIESTLTELDSVRRQLLRYADLFENR